MKVSPKLIDKSPTNKKTDIIHILLCWKREKRERARIHTNLIKCQLDLKKKVDKKVRGKEKVKYAFAAVNNQLGLSLERDGIKFFKLEEELNMI